MVPDRYIEKTYQSTSIDIESSSQPHRAPILADLQKAHGFKHILAAAGDIGRDTLPRVGALLDVQPISEITEVVDAKTFKRPMYAGNAIATVQSTDDVVLATVRPTAFEPAEGGTGTYFPAFEPAEGGANICIINCLMW